MVNWLKCFWFFTDDWMIRRFDTMRTIFAEYNPNQNSIDVYTSAGFTWQTHHFFHVNTSRHTHISFYASTSNVETPLSVTPIGIEVPTNSTIFPVRSSTSFPSIFRLYCRSSCSCFSTRCFSSLSSVSFFSAFPFSSLSSSSFLAFSVPGSTSSVTSTSSVMLSYPFIV